jgi:hypothetical protein
MYGRVAEDPATVNRIADLASLTASTRANAAGKYVEKKFGSEGQKLVKEIADYEAATGRRIYEVREKVRPAADATEQDLVNRMTNFLENMREYANTTTAEFANRRNVEAFGIKHRENYVPHTLTPEARKFIAGQKWQGGANAKTIQQMLGMSGSEFAKGPGVLRGRTLQQGQKWLGKELKSNVGDGAASIAEINFISENVLKFKWFEEDGAQYLSNYLDSIVNQTKRVAFIDRLFDYGGDAVKKLTVTRTPDMKLAKQWSKIIDGYDNAMSPILKQIADELGDYNSVLEPRLELARRLLDLKPGSRILTDEQLSDVRRVIDETIGDVAEGKRILDSQPLEVKYAYADIIDRIDSHLGAAKEALEISDEQELIGRLGLRPLYQRLFPGADIPNDFKTMAEDILDASDAYFSSEFEAAGGLSIEQARNLQLPEKINDPDISKILNRFTEEPAAVYSNVNIPNVPTNSKQVAANLTALKKLIEEQGVENPTQLFRGAKQNPIFDIFTGTERPGKPLSFSENYDIAKDFPGNVYTFEPGELRGIRIDDYSTSDFPEEIEWLVDPYSVVEATASNLNPEYAKMAREQVKELTKRSKAANSEARAVNSIMRALRNKPNMDRAQAIENSMQALRNEIMDITSEADARISSLVGGKIKDALADTPRKFAEVEPQNFFNAISKAGNTVKNGQRVGDTLSIYTQEEYGAMRTFLSPDGKTGYAVKPDGDLVSVFNIGGKGMGEDAVFDAIMHSGATKLDAFDQNGYLPNKYRQFGFKEVDRLQWDPQYAPPKWKDEYGTPDVVFMELDERVKKYVAQSDSPTVPTSAGASPRGVPRKTRQDTGLPGWVPDGIRNRFYDSARGNARFGKLTTPKRVTTPDVTGTVEAQISKIKKSTSGKVARRQQKLAELKAIADTGASLKDFGASWDNGVGKVYGDDLRKLTDLLETNPPTGAAGEATAIWAAQTFETLKSLKTFGMVLEPAERDLMKKIIVQMKGLESRLAEWESGKAMAVENYRKIVSGEVAQKVSTDVIKGWQAIESLGVQMPPEVRDRMFTRVQQLGTPEGASRLRKMYDSYTRFFKVTAMLSPGFVVRNSYTAAFNNFVAGVSVGETKEALKFATNIWRHGVDKALSMVPEASRDLYEQALKVTYATGAGQTYDDILAPVLAGKGAKWINSKPVKLWSEANETAEVAFRFALGLSSLNKGMDFDSAVSTVARYHFDYTNLSSLDEFARNMIPFWIFASRNIPLQIINQITRPSAYRMYESLQRNYGLTEEEQAGLPSWIRDRGPIQFPGMASNSTLLPDLPQLDMQEQIRMMSDPMRLMSQANPLIKLPIELMGDRQLWNAVPFSDKPSQVRGPLDFPAYAIDALLGRANKNPRTGEYTTSSKTAYALPNLIPTLGQAQRLLPWLGGKSEYQDRASSSIASYFGLPYRRVGQEEQFNEQQRRQFAIRDYLSSLTRSGQLTPKQQ